MRGPASEDRLVSTYCGVQHPCSSEALPYLEITRIPRKKDIIIITMTLLQLSHAGVCDCGEK